MLERVVGHLDGYRCHFILPTLAQDIRLMAENV